MALSTLADPGVDQGEVLHQYRADVGFLLDRQQVDGSLARGHGRVAVRPRSRQDHPEAAVEPIVLRAGFEGSLDLGPGGLEVRPGAAGRPRRAGGPRR